MSQLRAVDVHGFGGGFTLGTVQSGFELTAKFSRTAGFGVYNCLANRHLLGADWESYADEPERWYPVDNVQLVFGNPPCSGFSTLSPKHFRGMSSSINECMWELVRYGALVKPEIIIFESVQQAFRQGLQLMRQLHAHLEEETGLTYNLHHVLHNNLSVGGCSLRRRYFWVASRVPFGVEAPQLVDVPVFSDVLRDLEPLGLTMARQPYRGAREFGDRVEIANSSGWAKRECHDGTGSVDGHDVYHSPTLARILDVFHEADWPQGQSISDVMRRLWAENETIPRGWDYSTRVQHEDGTIEIMPKWKRLVQTNFAMGHNQPFRWHADRPARVITGGACHLVVHPTQQRTLTHREAARVQGFPDAWTIWPVRNAPDLGPGWGKGVPVQAGRWIAAQAARALEGTPGADVGVPLVAHDRRRFSGVAPLERETVIDITDHWKRFDTKPGVG